MHRIRNLRLSPDNHQRIAWSQADILVIEVELGMLSLLIGGHDKIVLVYAQ
jgi:hypothetical protein